VVAITAALQQASSEQRGAVLGLLRQAGLPVADLEGEARPEFFVAVDGGEVIGAVGVERFGTAALLRSLVVEAAWRGHGIADALVRAAEDHARGAGVNELWLLTSDAAEYFMAREYVTADRTQAPACLRESAQFASLCPTSAACLRKALG